MIKQIQDETDTVMDLREEAKLDFKLDRITKKQNQ